MVTEPLRKNSVENWVNVFLKTNIKCLVRREMARIDVNKNSSVFNDFVFKSPNGWLGKVRDGFSTFNSI